MNWSAGTLYNLGSAEIYNGGLWDAQADNSTGGGGSALFVNAGTFRKSGGAGTTTIGWPFTNPGILSAQTGTVSLSGSYNLTAGTLKFGLNGSADYGKIFLSGSPALTGTVSANLNNGYYPVAGDLFNVLSYASETGTFTTLALPRTQTWNAIYGATIFTLTVSNSAPILPAQTNRSINELTLLTVTNTAVDLDLPANALTYTLLASPAGASIDTNGVITWTPAQTQSPSTNTFTTKVADDGSPSLSATNSFTVIVKEVNVAPVLPVISTQTVNELVLLTVTNTATNFNIHSTITGYTLVGPPAGMSISAGGVITWTPSQTQSPGTNTITTIVTNSNPYDLVNPQLKATNSFTVIVKEVNVAPVLPVISTQTVNELVLLTVTNTATNFNIHSTITGYTLVGPPAGMSISAGGVITWTPSQTQSPGTNTITTIVTNSNPYDLVNPQLKATNSFTVIVKEVNVAPTLPVVPTQAVNKLTLLTVTNTATESNIHATNLGYVLINPPAGMSISANGIITWTPGQTQSPGTNTITTVVTNTDSYDTVNPHLSATNSFTVIVYALTLAPISDYTVNAGQTVAFTASATDNAPGRTLTFSLLSPPSGATINSASGLFNWRPTVSQANTTNTVQVRVTDNGTPNLTDTKSFLVIVNPLAASTLASVNYTNGHFTLQISGTSGPDYIISASTNLTQWTDLFTNLSPSTPFQFTDTNAGPFKHRFYRVRPSP